MERKTFKITQEQIALVKKNLERLSIREAARRSGVSFYTAWHISKGSYETNEKLNKRFKKDTNGFFSWEENKIF